MFGMTKRINYLFDCYFINYLDIKDDDCIIDIGANNGDFAHLFEQ